MQRVLVRHQSRVLVCGMPKDSFRKLKSELKLGDLIKNPTKEQLQRYIERKQLPLTISETTDIEESLKEIVKSTSKTSTGSNASVTRISLFKELCSILTKTLRCSDEVAELVVAVILDDYQFEKVLERDNTAFDQRLLLKGKKNSDQTEVVIKFITKMQAEREIEILKQIGGNKGIVTLFDCFDIPHFEFKILVVKYHQPIHFQPKSKQELLRFITQTVEIVDFLASRGIIHCDLNPSNVIVDSDGTVTLIDFGMAVNTFFWDLPKGFRGTLNYAAPEILNKKETSFKVDSWGLGVIFAELVLQETPLFPGNSKNEVLSEIKLFHKELYVWQEKAKGKDVNLFDENIWKLVIGLLAINPKDRMTAADAKQFLYKHFPQTEPSDEQ